MSAPQTSETTETPRWRVIGPGLVVAATGVGSADMVATLVAGSNYGYMLLWAVILGVLLKIVLVEGAGRYTVATGRTIFEGWRSLGRWPVWYFAPYVVIWGFVYAASAMSSTALPIAALFPEGSFGAQVWPWAVLTGIIAFLMIWFSKYRVFERISAALVGLMFVTIVILAVIAAPNFLDTITGLVPLIPEGGVFNTLALAGGVGGTITLAAYGYWLREKGWDKPRFLRVMRIDNAMAYVVTGVFVIAMLIVGAEVVRAAGVSLSSGDQSLLQLDGVLRERYGDFIGVWFLVGFWAAGFSSVLGVWNGVSLMFADFMGNVTGKGSDHPDSQAGGKWFKVYLLWLTFPPMLLLLLDQPIFLVLLYGFLGALFMPFLALTLLPILNTDRVPPEYRNKWYLNVALGLTALLFVVLGVYQAAQAIIGVFSG
ncbi:Nramp family divalent metal transporter [Microbacterium marinilacus]|uniref:Nramp family divalent metal transporter n=1 Tax=Microbacterium marinilacus TaxID=415209 RepID=A0ABP7BMT1_9MICO|nr:Nramp family divalent metal transporter [Microbacterium marinilacus]MBY0689708.1 Nramp family divalent metal transporter [Microbacterium marinilacus]